MALTRKQQKFIDEYFACGMNGTQAAIRAGYSVETARFIAYENLTKPHIREEIDRIYKANTMPAEEILARLSEYGRGDLGDVWDETTGQVNWETARALGKTGIIKRVKHKTTRVSNEKTGEEIETFEDEIELHDPIKAMHILAKVHGMLIDRLKVEVTWQDEAVNMIRAGELDYPAAMETFDHDEQLVKSLFAKAQVSVSVSKSE
jgi:phage terminase small subunit